MVITVSVYPAVVITVSVYPAVVIPTVVVPAVVIPTVVVPAVVTTVFVVTAVVTTVFVVTAVVLVTRLGLLAGGLHVQGIQCHCVSPVVHGNKRHNIRHRPSGPKVFASEMEISISVSSCDEFSCPIEFSHDCYIFQK